VKPLSNKKLVVLGILTLGLGVALVLLWQALRPGNRNLLALTPPDTRHPADKKWSELPQTQLDQLFKLSVERIKSLSDFAYNTHSELTKYLFAANTGAAAGMFLLLKDQHGERLHLIAFYLFIAGSFFVGLAHLFCAWWADQMSRGAAADLNAWGRDEITMREADALNRARYHSKKKRVIGAGLWLSFFLLVAGGLTAAVPFWTTVK
jgi:hypothetical protein